MRGIQSRKSKTRVGDTGLLGGYLRIRFSLWRANGLILNAGSRECNKVQRDGWRMLYRTHKQGGIERVRREPIALRYQRSAAE